MADAANNLIAGCRRSAALLGAIDDGSALSTEQVCLIACRLLNAAALIERLCQWRDVATAPKDGEAILAVLRDDLVATEGRSDLDTIAGRYLVLRHPGLTEEGLGWGWNIAAPVGYGGIADHWIAGWMPLQPRPNGQVASEPAPLEPPPGPDRFVSPHKPPDGAERELLVVLSEEVVEVIREACDIGQRSAKTLRFGLAEVQPGQDRDNAERLGLEIGDLYEVVDRLVARGVIPEAAIAAGKRRKRDQLAKFLQSDMGEGA